MPATAVPAIVQSRFLSMLPTIQKYAYVRNRHLPPEERCECIAESCAWGWLWCLRAFEKGTLSEVNPRMITLYAARLYRSGRRFAGASNGDVLSRHSGSTVVRIGTGKEDADGNPRSIGALLTDSRHPRPLDTVRRSIDYAVAMKKPAVSRRGRACFKRLLRDHSRGHVGRIAASMGVSSPRVSQMKGEIGRALAEIGYGPNPRPAA